MCEKKFRLKSIKFVYLPDIKFILSSYKGFFLHAMLTFALHLRRKKNYVRNLFPSEKHYIRQTTTKNKKQSK